VHHVCAIVDANDDAPYVTRKHVLLTSFTSLSRVNACRMLVAPRVRHASEGSGWRLHISAGRTRRIDLLGEPIGAHEVSPSLQAEAKLTARLRSKVAVVADTGDPRVGFRLCCRHIMPITPGPSPPFACRYSTPLSVWMLEDDRHASHARCCTHERPWSRSGNRSRSRKDEEDLLNLPAACGVPRREQPHEAQSPTALCHPQGCAGTPPRDVARVMKLFPFKSCRENGEQVVCHPSTVHVGECALRFVSLLTL
jgi:hypothetical protein